MINGYASPFFQLGSGVRQGDPLSPSLFVLFLEPMLNYLRATTGHLGIPVAHDPTSHHLSAFADDVTGFLRTINDTPKFLTHVHHYAQSVGLQLNVSKTQVFRFHSYVPPFVTNPDSSPFMVHDSVSFLGVLQHSTPNPAGRFASILPDLLSRLDYGDIEPVPSTVGQSYCALSRSRYYGIQQQLLRYRKQSSNRSGICAKPFFISNLSIRLKPVVVLWLKIGLHDPPLNVAWGYRAHTTFPAPCISAHYAMEHEVDRIYTRPDGFSPLSN